MNRPATAATLLLIGAVLSLTGCQTPSGTGGDPLEVVKPWPEPEPELLRMLRQTPRELFDRLDHSLNNGDGYRSATNDAAVLAWSESHVMSAYVTMYEATGEARYLHKLVEHADSVLANRDDRRGFVDYRGQSGAGWRTFRYQVPPRPYCYVAHSGMITYPMARFAAIVVGTPALAQLESGNGSTLGEKARDYIDRVSETIRGHEWQWVEGPLKGEGYYKFPDDAPTPLTPGRHLPWNQQNAMGRTLIVMWQATGELAYRDKVAKMARLFRRMLIRRGETFFWQYTNDLDETDFQGCGEDISHATINVDFAIQAHLAGIVFTAGDLAAFAATFRQNVLRGDGTTSATVGGCGPVGGRRDVIALWLNLSPWDDGTIYGVALRAFRGPMDGKKAARPIDLAAAANLIRWIEESSELSGKAGKGTTEANEPTSAKDDGG